ncbi:hypothetical protein CC78DRAFT_588754 [Lojkania enalia]|uniref:F-box domain-containing protein n=1 Tax=Lojkania enalia TaxID=147567 RepID=A0A9P4NCT7_9PLEO|nr:hypothetical protein CC78DRAFT_588754 [Didymosphaeria enalia]
MDDLLPSYESVVGQNPWVLVARYLPSKDLCSAALVCQKWHEIFTPQLWGNPASHFGVQNDTVYVALTRFKRTLFYSRLQIRELTHTLHLPPAHAEIYGGPHDEWLRDCLERLPRLQSLIVNGLPFFDHASLLRLRHSSLWWALTHPNLFPSFGLRLLDASGCANATSTGLTEALPHFPDLVSLDLSKTFAAKDESVLTKLKYLPNLRVLKLRALGLKDSDVSIIAPSIGIRVRSLDLSENHLTDSSARLLLYHCFKETNQERHTSRASFSLIEDSCPQGENESFGTEDLDSHLRKKLTEGFVGSLAIEAARDLGITHLYLSKNMITVEGVSGLLRSKRLQVLDVGTLATSLDKPPHLLQDESGESLPLPGVEKLTPILANCAAERLVYLRINYAVVTDDTPTDATPSSRAELATVEQTDYLSDSHELDASEPPPPELDSSGPAIYELPGDTIKPLELPDSQVSTSNSHIPDGRPGLSDGNDNELPGLERTPTIEVTAELSMIKRGPAYAPEPVFIDASPPSPINPLLDTSGGLSPSTDASQTTASSCIGNSNPVFEGRRPRHDSMCYVEDLRARLDLRQAQENRLHPGMLPKNRTLVLTDVPTKTDKPEIVARLIQFIKDCGEEAEIARIRAKHTYTLPPGRSRKIAEREYARSLFALRKIVLEMAPPQATRKKISTSWREYPTKSSTEDADSEAFWEAATHDFSFFGDEECGLPNAEPGRHLPLAAMDGLMLAPQRPAPPPKPLEPKISQNQIFDVVSEISNFRKGTRAAYQALLQAGEAEPVVEGNWLGDITVVRQTANPEIGDLDYYGNRYQSGWFYR